MPRSSIDSISQGDLNSDRRPLCHIITPVGMLGYGFDETLTRSELVSLLSKEVPTAIILDSGSTDSGPQKLALGSMSCPRSAYVEDLSKLLRLVHDFRVPLIFSSSGGDGTDEHVREIAEIMEEITEANPEYIFKTISIFSGIDKAVVLTRLRNGRITGCGPYVPALTETDVLESSRVVAQIGPEPFVDVMDAEPDFDVIIGGRAYDPAPYAAYCIHQLKRQNSHISNEEIKPRLGGFLHMGKIMECGGHCSFPKSHGAVATVYASGVFDVRPTAPESICTPLSVAAHALYENTRPDVLRGPGGMMLLDASRYQSLADGKSVRVSGTTYQPSRSDGKPYELKLEAARIIGYRSIFMGSIKDPILISQLAKVLPLVKGYVRHQHKHVTSNWELDFHIYGRERKITSDPPGVFIVAEAIAETQDLANSLISKARVAMIHAPYPSQKATAGNVGYGIGGLMEIETGPCAEFSMYHLMELDADEEHLYFDDESDSISPDRRLIRSRIQVIGSGLPRSPKPTTTQLENDTGTQFSSRKDKSRDIAVSDQGPPPNPTALVDLCRVFRSKNAGPYEITIDAIFYSEADYQRIKSSGFLSRERVAEAIGIPADDIIWMGFFDPARAFKVTFPRVRSGRHKSAGGFMENDVHGSQEHTGLARLKLPRARATIPMLKGWLGGAEQRLWWKAMASSMAGVGLLFLARRAARRRKRVL